MATPKRLDADRWPGNIRQLRANAFRSAAVERAVLFADGDLLEVGHFALS